VNTIRNFRFHKTRALSGLREQIIESQEGLGFMKLSIFCENVGQSYVFNQRKMPNFVKNTFQLVFSQSTMVVWSLAIGSPCNFK
jgi:hypothetical protein